MVQKIQEDNTVFQKQIDLMHSINTILKDLINPKDVEKNINHSDELLDLNRELSIVKEHTERAASDPRDLRLDEVLMHHESDEKKETGIREEVLTDEDTSNIQVIPKNGCQKFCEIIRPQDWSEYPLVLASIASIVSTIFHAAQDSDQWLAIPNAFVGVSCIVAALAIHILGRKKQSIDDSAKKIDKSISHLVNGIEGLENRTLTELNKDIETLRGEISAIETNNKELEEQVEKLKADVEVKKKQISEIQTTKKDFEARVKALQEEIEKGRQALKPAPESPFKQRLQELRKQAAAIAKAEEEEVQRHERRMEGKDQK